MGRITEIFDFLTVPSKDLVKRKPYNRFYYYIVITNNLKKIRRKLKLYKNK